MLAFTIRCPFCKKKIRSDVARCPYCTTDLAHGDGRVEMKKKFKSSVTILWILGILAFIGIMSAARHSTDVPAVDPFVPRVHPEQQVIQSFDVPALLGKNIDDIRKILGTPSDAQLEPTALQMKMTDSWENQYTKNGNILLISYNPKTRKVIDFFVGPASGIGSKQVILQIGNLLETDARYTLEFVPARNASGYTGVIVKRKN